MSPPPRLENLVGLLLPPACREHVLGDLHESYTSDRRYVVDVLSILGPIVISRIRRTTDVQVLFLESFALYLSFSAAALYTGRMGFLYGQAGFARLAIPTVVAVVSLLFCNAYSDHARPSPLKPFLQSAGSISLAFLGQAVIFDTRPELAIPFSVMLYGSLLSALLVSVLRTLFPSMQSSFKPSPLRAQRLFSAFDLVPAKLTVQHLRQKPHQLQSPPTSKTLILCVAVIAIALLLVAAKWRGEFIRPQHVLLAAAVALFAVKQIGNRD